MGGLHKIQGQPCTILCMISKQLCFYFAQQYLLFYIWYALSCVSYFCSKQDMVTQQIQRSKTLFIQMTSGVNGVFKIKIKSLKGEYKTGAEQTRASYTTRVRIRCHWEVSILFQPVTTRTKRPTIITYHI